MFCFFHNQFIEEDKVAISLNDRGFSLGDGVFDTQMAVNGQLPDADLHFERLLNDAHIIGIAPEKTITELHTISSMLIARNSASAGRWIVRTQITRGEAARGLLPPVVTHPTIVMRLIPAPQVNNSPITAIIAKSTRRNEFSPLSRIKSLNYEDNILAILEAKDAGADDAIILNTKDHVTCASASNIFIVEAGVWVTPPLEDGVLLGITRQKLIGEHSARQEHITIERLQNADEIYQSNSVIGVRKINLAQ